MSKKVNMLGVIVGVIIMIFSGIVFSFDVKATSPNMKQTDSSTVSEPEFEADSYYGGDAYTGIQQAAAQAANNLIPVFNAIEAANNSIAKAASAESRNAEMIATTVKNCTGFILLSFGLFVISKSIDLNTSDKKKAASDSAIYTAYAPASKTYEPTATATDDLVLIDTTPATPPVTEAVAEEV